MKIGFTSLSQRLLVGYIVAIIALLLFFSWITRSELNPAGQFFAALIVISGIFLVAHLFFIRNFIRPIHNLIQITEEHANTSFSRLRAEKVNDDELGDLMDAYNDMMTQIQLREEAIVSERDRVAIALEQADDYANVTQATNQKLALEVQVRKRIETKLTEFQQFLNSIINSMPSALIAVDRDLTVTQWNQEATRISGTSDTEAKGSYVVQVMPVLAGHEDWISDVWQTQTSRTLHNIEFYIDQETIRHYDIVVYPLQNTAEPSAVIRIDDVTEKIQLEETIVQSEKVMSLGGMAAGMAHEINNPISAIIQNVQNIQRRLDPSLAANQELAALLPLDLDIVRDYLARRRILNFLDNISDSGLRASKLVANMLQFSRANDLTLMPCLIVEVLEKAINIALTDDQLHTFKDNFELNFDQDFQAPQVEVLGVFTELEQVLLNLIKNAAFAIRERKMTINDIDEGIINIHQSIRGDYCVIQVSDNGIGMSQTTRKRIFEPFFTTKEVGSGTGLGLSVSYYIVSSHHKGQMQVESEHGAGTVFEILLPLYQKETPRGQSTD